MSFYAVVLHLGIYRMTRPTDMMGSQGSRKFLLHNSSSHHLTSIRILRRPNERNDERPIYPMNGGSLAGDRSILNGGSLAAGDRSIFPSGGGQKTADSWFDDGSLLISTILQKQHLLIVGLPIPTADCFPYSRIVCKMRMSEYGSTAP